MPLVLILGYPFVAHWGAVSGRPEILLYWLAMLLAALALKQPSRRLAGLFVGAGLGLAGVTALFGEPLAPIAIKLPPVLILLGFASLFGWTLLPRRIPLVTRIGRLVSGELTPGAERHGRRLTLFWACFLLALAVESTLLALFAAPWLWSLFTNVLNYVLIALAFAAEYPIRRRILSDEPHAPFLDYLRQVMAARLALGDTSGEDVLER